MTSIPQHRGGKSEIATGLPIERSPDRLDLGGEMRMFRAGWILIRRLFAAASLLLLLICGAEVGVRTYEACTGNAVCSAATSDCGDSSHLTIPSWSFHIDLKPLEKAEVLCGDAALPIEVQTNSFALRGPEIEVPKPRDLYRIVVLGDETIYAPETAETDHFCSLLQEQLQLSSRTPVEVINAGIPGHCPLTEYLLFKLRLLALQPDLVILHFDWSDVADDRQIRRNSHSDDKGVPQLCPNSRLVASNKVRPHQVWRSHFRLLDWGLSSLSSEWKQRIACETAVSREVDTNPYAWLREERPEQNLAFRDSARPIADLIELCQSANLQFVLMTSPKPWQVSAKCSRGPGVRVAAGVAQDACFSTRTPFEQLARFAERMKVPFADGSLVLAPGRDAEANFLRYAPRWSPTGHQRMADLVCGCLKENVSGPWNRRYLRELEQPISREMARPAEIQRISGIKSIPSRPEKFDGIDMR